MAQTLISEKNLKSNKNSKLNYIKNNPSRTVFLIANFIFMIVILVVMMIPLLKVLSDSLDTTGFYGLNLIPTKISFDAYQAIITNKTLYWPFIISIYVTVVGAALAMALTTMGAYVLAQKDLPGRSFFMYFILFTMVFHAGMIPAYMLIKNIGLMNTLWAVIIPLSVTAFNLILLRNFFSEIALSLIEAAEIDGCTPFGIFWRIVLPMSAPALATIGLFCVVEYWNEFFHFIIYINDPNLYNFQVKLREMILSDTFNPSAGVYYGKSLQNAAIVVVIIPLLILYPFLQKYFVKGINLGSIKG
jgi:putative aldouronate transport system permease protein